MGDCSSLALVLEDVKLGWKSRKTCLCDPSWVSRIEKKVAVLALVVHLPLCFEPVFFTIHGQPADKELLYIECLFHIYYLLMSDFQLYFIVVSTLFGQKQNTMEAA